MDEEPEQQTPSRPVAFRPYNVESAAVEQQDRRRSKASFKPMKPSQQRPVEKVSLSSSGAQSIGSTLQAQFVQQQHQFAEGKSRDGNVAERFAGMSLKKFGVSAIPSVVASRASSTAQGGAAPRKVKERQQGKSLDLMDLSFSGETRLIDGELKYNYAPVTVPYYNTEEQEEEEQGKRDTEQRTKNRPKMVHIDEANSKASSKLLDEKGQLAENNFFLMQLPCVLPELANPEDEVQRDQEDAASAGAGATITRLPDGKLGKLRIYKSGKVKMEIGGVSFCVDPGCDTFFQQDLAMVCPLANEVLSLGQVNSRMVVTPDLESMFADLGDVAPGEKLL
eukprot:TRINITY_DN106163_c0_g1_i1.p1 TRINITY_DN106163_c0_g1~~TRINITY_DN106163_c0_g1_i1.p1  ORF type:complete len:336 (-),score=74.77 TRINITY_DN106163_c0_g1_i1:141-1148(-)